jgi:hypothetical protein
MEHETKHKDHQRREDGVVNIWHTWMSEIPTKLEKNKQHLLYGAMDEQGRMKEQMSCLGSRKKKMWLFNVSGYLVPAGVSNQY